MRDVDLAVLAAAFDALVAVLVERSEVLPELLVSVGDFVAVGHGGEFGGEVADDVGVEFVLVLLLRSC